MSHERKELCRRPHSCSIKVSLRFSRLCRAPARKGFETCVPDITSQSARTDRTCKGFGPASAFGACESGRTRSKSSHSQGHLAQGRGCNQSPVRGSGLGSQRLTTCLLPFRPGRTDSTSQLFCFACPAGCVSHETAYYIRLPSRACPQLKPQTQAKDNSLR